MANTPSEPNDDIDALAQKYGGGFKSAPSSSSAPAGSSSQPQEGGDEIDALAQKYGAGFKKKSQTDSAQAAPDEYEARVRKFMPEAKKRIAALGTLGGVETGIHKIPVIGNIVTEIGADIAAALPRAISEAEGETYGERRQNIKAGVEAMKRAGAEQNPYVSTGTEIAGSMLLPVGGIAKVGEALTGSGIAGLALEGAGTGALTAATEKFGTKSEKDMPSVGESALIGGGLGGTLGVIGKGVGKAVEKVAPDWMKAMGAGRDNYQFRELAKAFDQDVKEGNVRMTFQQYEKALAEGQPVSITDLGGPRYQDAIKKAFHDQPELARDFQIKLNGRLADAGRRFNEFAQDLADSDLNVDTISNQAKRLAKAEKQNAYDLAINDPANGRGAWKQEWNEYLNLPLFKQAIRKTEDDLANDIQYGIGAARRGAAEGEELVSPFRVESVSPGRPKTQGGLEKEVYVMEDPSKINMKYLDYLQRNLNDAIDGIAGNAAGGVKQRMIAIRNDIVDSVTNPESSLYNSKYAKAYGSTQLFRGENDAFNYGRSLLSARRNAAKATEIENATSQMTEPEKKFFMQGVLADMLSKSRRADGSINTEILQNFFTPGPTRNALENAFNPQQFQDLQRFVNTESVISDAARKAATFGGRAPQISRDLHTIMWTLLFDKIALAKFAGQYLNKYIGDKYASSLIEKLMSDDPAMIRAAYDDLSQNKAIRGGLTDALGKWVGRGGLLAGEIPGKKDGGPVDRKKMSHTQATKRIPELTEGAKLLAEGKISKQDYDALVNKHKPITPYESVPKPATDAEMRNALKKDQIPFIGGTEKLKEGHPVGNRLDIPAFVRHGVWVPTTHEQQAGFKAGPKIGHSAVSHVTNAVFGVHEPSAFNYAQGKSDKGTWGVIKGNHVPTSPDAASNLAKEALNHPDWAQVGMDPERHSYFYDRRTTQPILSAQQAVQVGPLVLAHKPVYGNKDDLSFGKGGRTKRATGGRIPDADKAFKAAKREVDRATKPLMKLHDDHIVQALRIAKGII